MKDMFPLVFIVLICGWLIYDNTGTEITIYNAFCTKERVNGVCKAEEQTANQTTYKVFPDQQTVVYWTGDYAPSRFPYCAVRDVKNWSCKWESANTIPSRRYEMLGGQYYEYGDNGLIPKTDIFYPVSRWHWWSLRIPEWIRGAPRL